MANVANPKFVLSGKVVRGAGYGRILGFPTANMDRIQWARLKHKPPHGVYAGRATLGSGKSYKAAIVIGPLDKKGLPRIEGYLLGFSGNLYGKRLSFELYKYIRKFKSYKSELELKKAIELDVRQVNKIIK